MPPDPSQAIPTLFTPLQAAILPLASAEPTAVAALLLVLLKPSSVVPFASTITGAVDVAAEEFSHAAMLAVPLASKFAKALVATRPSAACVTGDAPVEICAPRVAPG